MSTIFQLTHGELTSLLRFLRPNHGDVSRSAQLDARHLRVLITEWLLLNGLSTLHRFERDPPCAADGTFGWRMPTDVDCQSCGRYRVGKPIYGGNESAVIVNQPTNQLNPMAESDQPPPLLYVDGGTPSTSAVRANRPIRSKHGNLQRVHYGLPPRESTPTRASARGGAPLDDALRRRDKPSSFRLYSDGRGRLTQSYSYSNGYDSARSDDDKCADMCLVCLFCECTPPSEALKKRQNAKNGSKTRNDNFSNINGKTDNCNSRTVNRPT